MQNDGYVIYFPDEPDFMFFRSALMTVMQASEAVKRDYGKYADRITFKGELGKAIYDNFAAKNYNLNATMRHVDAFENEILLDCEKKVKIAKGDVIREIGFEYTIEKEVRPEATINIVKLF